MTGARWRCEGWCWGPMHGLAHVTFSVWLLYVAPLCVCMCMCVHAHTYTHTHTYTHAYGLWDECGIRTGHIHLNWNQREKGVVMFTKSWPQVSRASCPEVGTRSGPTHQLSLTPISTSDPLSPHTSLRTARTVARGAPFCAPVFSQCWTPQDPSLTFRHGAVEFMSTEIDQTCIQISALLLGKGLEGDSNNCTWYLSSI